MSFHKFQDFENLYVSFSLPFHWNFHHFCNFSCVTRKHRYSSVYCFRKDHLISTFLLLCQTIRHSPIPCSRFSPSPRYHAIAAEIISTETCCVYDCKTKKISSSLFYYGLQFTSYHPSHDNLNIIIVEYIRMYSNYLHSFPRDITSNS